jgi:UDP-GlcNAc3NAcA epimerase
MTTPMKVLTVVGARPQFIKAGTVSRAIDKCSGIEEVIMHTGQHYDFSMSEVFFIDLALRKPKYSMYLSNREHVGMISEMLVKIEEVINIEKPEIVLVYGDTNTTLAAALCAAKLHIPLAHVEAGLRSFNRAMPEELNRILTDHSSSLLFCPTKLAIQNLANESITKGVYEVGDVMYDSLLYYDALVREKPIEISALHLADKFCLATIHRQENTNNPETLKSIINTLQELSSHMQVVLPLHPGTKKKMEAYGISCNGIEIIEPVGYFSMIYLLRNCFVVMTDSGGLQKEGYFFKKIVGILRKETEWQELVDTRAAFLLNDNRNLVEDVLTAATQEKQVSTNIYGDGTAATKIVDQLLKFLLITSS